MSVISDVRQLTFELRDLPMLPVPDRVLMADPRDFDLVYAINPHMVDLAGRLKQVDRERARAEWSALKIAFEDAGLRVDVLPPLAGFPDLVFCASQALPIPGAALPDRLSRLVPSRMANEERRLEVPHVTQFLEKLGYRLDPLTGNARRLEGMADGLWHPGRRLLWAGCGPRSERAAWDEIAKRYELPVITLSLFDPTFYHLDLCLALLSEDTCLWYPAALDAPSQALVRAFFPHAIEAEVDDARVRLACCATALPERRVLIQRGCKETCRRLREAGFEPVEVETDEYLKSGGSVFCMKLMHGPI